VTVFPIGNGGGTVLSGDGTINCPGTCAGTFTTSSVTLLASPAPTSSWTGWSFNCTGNPCTLATNAATIDVSSMFTAFPVLTLAVTGSSGLVETDANLTCESGSICRVTLPVGTAVTLTPSASTVQLHSNFDAWDGACRGQDPNTSPDYPTCHITVTTDTTVSADFAADSVVNLVAGPTSYPGGTVTLDGMVCDPSSVCSAHYFPPTNGVPVHLEGFSNPGACVVFDGFVGPDCDSFSTTCDFRVSGTGRELRTIDYSFSYGPPGCVTNQ
jgi:hypothetical protein